MERVDAVKHTLKPQAGTAAINFTVRVCQSSKVLRSCFCSSPCKTKTTECQRSVSCVSVAKTTEDEWRGVRRAGVGMRKRSKISHFITFQLSQQGVRRGESSNTHTHIPE